MTSLMVARASQALQEDIELRARARRVTGRERAFRGSHQSASAEVEVCDSSASLRCRQVFPYASNLSSHARFCAKPTGKAFCGTPVKKSASSPLLAKHRTAVLSPMPRWYKLLISLYLLEWEEELDQRGNATMNSLRPGCRLPGSTASEPAACEGSRQTGRLPIRVRSQAGRPAGDAGP